MPGCTGGSGGGTLAEQALKINKLLSDLLGTLGCWLLGQLRIRSVGTIVMRAIGTVEMRSVGTFVMLVIGTFGLRKYCKYRRPFYHMQLS